MQELGITEDDVTDAVRLRRLNSVDGSKGEYETRAFPCLGTGGVPLLAKRRGLVPSVTFGLEKLRRAGLWLSDDLVKLLKTRAGE